MRTRIAASGIAFALVGLASVFACTGEDATSSSGGFDLDAAGFDSATNPDPRNDSAAPDAAAVDAADAAVDAAPAPPSVLGSRLVLWLAADRGVTADGINPMVWTDQSGAGNNATQAAVESQPMLVDGSGGGTGGKPTLHFSGGQFLQVADNASLEWSQSDFTVFTVERHSNDTVHYALLYAKWTDVVPYPGIFLWADYPTTTSFITRLDLNNEVYSTDAGYNDDVLRVVGMRKNGPDVRLYVGSVLAGERPDASVADPTGFDSVGIPAYIGGRPSGIQMLQGDISEVVAIKGTVSDAELTNLQAYLGKKYGL